MASSVLAAGASLAWGQRLEVTVTNVTKSEYFTPLLIVSHTDDFRLFSPGGDASNELEQLAEGGDTGPLLASLEGRLDVHSAVATDGLLGPGETVTVEISSGSRFNPRRGQFTRVSVVAMLIPTNDTFVAVNGALRPNRAGETVRIQAPAYDSGTEANDELCDNMPGPFGCPGTGEGFNASRDGAEGFIYVSNGIQGVGDLPAPTWDWHNPVASVSITILQ
jgi:hypothetical protein